MLRVPPVGSSKHLGMYAKMFGCREPQGRSRYDELYECMHSRFGAQMEKLRVDPALNDTSLIEQRLAEAAAAPSHGQPRYTFVPAAVGAPSVPLMPDVAGGPVAAKMPAATGAPFVP